LHGPITKGRGSVGKRGASPLSFSRRGGLRGEVNKEP